MFIASILLQDSLNILQDQPLITESSTLIICKNAAQIFMSSPERKLSKMSSVHFCLLHWSTYISTDNGHYCQSRESSLELISFYGNSQVKLAVAVHYSWETFVLNILVSRNVQFMTSKVPFSWGSIILLKIFNFWRNDGYLLEYELRLAGILWRITSSP